MQYERREDLINHQVNKEHLMTYLRESAQQAFSKQVQYFQRKNNTLKAPDQKKTTMVLSHAGFSQLRETQASTLPVQQGFTKPIQLRLPNIMQKGLFIETPTHQPNIYPIINIIF